MIKLIQEERDMGTKEVQEVMQQVDVKSFLLFNRI